jgi:hypothetical protein
VTAQIDPSERPLYVDFQVDSEVDSKDALLELLSPRLRRLGDDHTWSFFEIESGLRLNLSPPKPRPRRKKGLVNISLELPELTQYLSVRWAHDILVGGLTDVAALDQFLHRHPPADQLRGMEATLGWDNLEVITPDGTRFFSLHFGGKHANVIAEWYAASALSAGLAVASFDGLSLHIRAPSGSSEEQLSRCSGVLHNVWESSLKTVAPLTDAA